MISKNCLALRTDHDRGAVGPARELDRVDQSIIEALQKNGRESFRRIAAQVGVSEATVRARYGRLCDDDILVELVCSDRRQLLELTNRLRSLDGVLSTESFLYLALWKQLYDWGARIADGSPLETATP